MKITIYTLYLTNHTRAVISLQFIKKNNIDVTTLRHTEAFATDLSHLVLEFSACIISIPGIRSLYTSVQDGEHLHIPG